MSASRAFDWAIAREEPWLLERNEIADSESKPTAMTVSKIIIERVTTNAKPRRRVGDKTEFMNDVKGWVYRMVAITNSATTIFVRVMPMYSSELELWLPTGLMDLRRKKPALVRERAQVEGVKHLIRDHSTAAAQQGEYAKAAEQGAGGFGNLGEGEGAVATTRHISRSS